MDNVDDSAMVGKSMVQFRAGYSGLGQCTIVYFRTSCCA